MNSRRGFLQAAAAVSTLPFLPSARARELSEPGRAALPVTRPVEVDLADPAAAGYLAETAVDAYVRLAEPDPDEYMPDQLSGTHLRIIEVLGGVCLTVEIDALQRNGAVLSHCLGYLDMEDLALLIEAEIVPEGDVIQLPFRDLCAPECGSFSGAWLEQEAAATELRVRMSAGGHILGLLRGSVLATFLNCLRLRCAQTVR